MFGYYVGLAPRSLKRTPIFTGLMVIAIGPGIGVRRVPPVPQLKTI